jgi:hypothetical protein
MSEHVAAAPVIEVAPVPPPQPTKSRLLRWGGKLLRDLVAVLLWAYVITKLFIYDIDVYAVDHYVPDAKWVVTYKFFVYIGIWAALFLIFNRNRILFWSAYVAFFPLILVLWKVPYTLFRNRSWMIAFSLVDWLLAMIRGLRYRFIASALYLIAIASALSTSNRLLLWSASCALFILLLLIYAFSILHIYRPTSLYHLSKSLITTVSENFLKNCRIEEEMRNVPVARLNEQQLVKWKSNLGMYVIFSRSCLFAANKVRDYQNSALSMISSMVTIFNLIFVTTLTFAIINVALYKISPSFFDTQGIPSLFVFVYYSFNSIIFSSIRELVPIVPVSQVASMAERLCALFLIVIFVSLVLNVKSQRFSRQLDGVIESLESEGRRTEGFFRSEFNVQTAEDAIAELTRLEYNFIRFIVFLSR